MPSKNDLSALKAPRSDILPSADAPAAPGAPAPRRRTGPQPKSASAKRTYKVQLALTPAEGEKLREKAGLAADATYVYAKLKELGIPD